MGLGGEQVVPFESGKGFFLPFGLRLSHPLVLIQGICPFSKGYDPNVAKWNREETESKSSRTLRQIVLHMPSG